MATYSSTPAWKIPQTEKPGGLQSWGREESDTIGYCTLHHIISPKLSQN